MPTIGNHSMSYWDYCFVWCCWPICPTMITNKVAFLPPEPTYDLCPSDDLRKYEMVLSKEVDSSGLAEVQKQEVYYEYTNRENRVVLIHIKPASQSRIFILYSHGNAEDLGIIHRRLVTLSLDVKCDILSYDYSGYGRSSGEPSEKNLYSDIEAAWKNFQIRYAIQPEQIVLYGFSLGSVPTIFLATRVRCAGVVLHAPMASGMRLLWKGKTSRRDTMNNLEKVTEITSPVLVIHGTDDETIDISHGKKLYEHCPRAVEPLWIQGAGHNNIELYGQYVDRLRKFINEELSN